MKPLKHFITHSKYLSECKYEHSKYLLCTKCNHINYYWHKIHLPLGEPIRICHLHIWDVNTMINYEK